MSTKSPPLMRREESDFAGTVLFASSDFVPCAAGALSTVPTVCGVMALTRGPDASAGLESWAAVKHAATRRRMAGRHFDFMVLQGILDPEISQASNKRHLQAEMLKEV